MILCVALNNNSLNLLSNLKLASRMLNFLCPRKISYAKETVNAFSSRIVFFTLFVVAFIAWNLQRQLQESAEFTAQKDSAEKSCRLQEGMKDSVHLRMS